MASLIPHYFKNPPGRPDCVWCKQPPGAAIHYTPIVEATQRALDEAREEGRQEVKDQVNEILDHFAPHAVAWWNEMNEATGHRIFTRSK